MFDATSKSRLRHLRQHCPAEPDPTAARDSLGPVPPAPTRTEALHKIGVTLPLELAEQIERGEIPEPATVIVAAGTLGTAAGLALGFAIAGLKTRVKAVRITARIVTNERVLARLIRGAEDLLHRAGTDIDVAANAIDRVELLHDHIGRGYGLETEEGKRAVTHFDSHGILLDPTYTAKAAAAFMARAADLPKPVLFWQTLSAAEPPGAGDAVLAALPKPFRDYILSTGAQ